MIRSIQFSSLAVLLAASLSHASDQPLADEKRLLAGEIIVTTQDVPGSGQPRVTVRGVIDAKPEVIWPILINCGDYKTSMPRISKSVLLEKTGDLNRGTTVCTLTAAMPFPLSDLVGTVASEFRVEGGVYERTWSLVRGDYKTLTGSWRLEALMSDPSRTLAIYTAHVEPKLAVPDFIVAAAQNGVLPDMFDKLRELTKH